MADEWLDGGQNPDDITFVVLEKNTDTTEPTKKIEDREGSIKRAAQA